MLLPEQARQLVATYVELRKLAYAQAEPVVTDYFARCRAKTASASPEGTGLPAAVMQHLNTP